MADKILIVDDEPEIADLVSLYLQNENFIVDVYKRQVNIRRRRRKTS